MTPKARAGNWRRCSRYRRKHAKKYGEAHREYMRSYMRAYRQKKIEA